MFLTVPGGYVGAAIVAFGLGAVIFLLTRFLLGDRANMLPGGALAASIAITPWWLTVPLALLGHLLSVLLAKRFGIFQRKNANGGKTT